MATINTILVKTRDSSLSSPDTDAANSDVKIGEFALNAKTGKLWVGTKLGDTNGSAYPGGSSDEAMWVGAQILDQNDMSSNSDTKLATQQSIKAYVDSSVLAYDIDSLTAFSGVPHATNDEFVISDNGTELRADMTMVANGAFALVSSDVTIAAGGAATIANNAITLAKMASGTDGNIISYDTSGDPVAIATGSDGQVLTSAGSGQPPAFETPSSAAISTYTNSGNDRLITSVNSTSVNSEANLTYDGTLLKITDAAGSDTLLKLESTDTGTGDAPRLDLDRDSDSPADDDEIGRIRFNANTTDGTLKTYAGIEAEIVDKTNTANYGRLNFEVATNGTITTIATVDSGGFNLASSHDYEIAGTNVLGANTLGSGVVTSSLTAVGTIATGVWQGTAIASSYIAADAITGGKIADDTINSEHYVAASIDLEHMSANSVDSDQYVNGSVDNVHLANDGITISTTDTSLGGTVTFPTMSNVDMGGDFTIGNQTNDTCAITGLLAVAGGYGSSGLTISAAGEIEMNGQFTSDSTVYGQSFIASGGGLVITNGATIGSASDTDAITISTAGKVTFSQGISVAGDLEVSGSTTTLEADNIAIKDKELFVGVAGGMTLDKAWSRSGTTVTVTSTAHGFSDNEYALITGSSVPAGTPENVYQVQSETSDTFSFTGVASGSTSGTLDHSTANTTEATADASGIYVPGTSLHSIKYTTGEWTATDGMTISGALNATGATTLDGAVTLGNATGDDITITGYVASHVLPKTDDTYNLGSSSKEWNDLYVDGDAYIDTLKADNLGANLDCNSFNMTSVDINSGAIDGTAIGANSATTVVATTLTATTSNLGTLGSNVDHSNYNSTNVDIDSGAIDGVTIGAASAGAGTFGTLTCTTLVPTTLGSALDGNGMAITNINVDSGFIDNTPVGASTASSGAFTTLSSTGNTTLGDAVTDTITFTGRIVSGGDLVPIADSTSDLGTTALRFQEIFVDAVTGATISGGTY